MYQNVTILVVRIYFLSRSHTESLVIMSKLITSHLTAWETKDASWSLFSLGRPCAFYWLAHISSLFMKHDIRVTEKKITSPKCCGENSYRVVRSSGCTWSDMYYRSPVVWTYAIAAVLHIVDKADLNISQQTELKPTVTVPIPTRERASSRRADCCNIVVPVANHRLLIIIKKNTHTYSENLVNYKNVQLCLLNDYWIALLWLYHPQIMDEWLHRKSQFRNKV